MFKEKRAFNGTNALINTTGPDSNLGEGRENTPGNPMAATANSDLPNLNISIEQALEQGKTLEYQQFCEMAQRMVFSMQDFQKLSQLIHQDSD